MNVVIVVIDALRARNLGCYGYDKPTSPIIDSFAEDSLVFKNCHASANCTDPSLTTILSGKHPINHGVTAHGPLTWEENYERLREGGTRLIPEGFSSEGYSTYNMDLDIVGPWFRRSFGDTGEKAERSFYKRFRSKVGVFLRHVSPKLYEFAQDMHRRVFGISDPRVRADKLTDQAIESVRNVGGDFFMLVHYWDTHSPYNAPEKYREIFEGTYDGGSEKIGEVIRDMKSRGKIFSDLMKSVLRRRDKLREVWCDYDACIRQVDSNLGRLLSLLPEDTLTILTSDHGEKIGRKKPYGFGHAGIREEVTHVPLIVNSPGIKPGENRDLVQHMDLVEEIVSRFGLSNDGLLDGEDEREAAVVNMNKNRVRVLRTERWKYAKVLSKGKIGEAYWYQGDGDRLYDMEKEGEEVNLAENMPDKAEELERKLEEKVAEYRTKREKGRIKASLGKRRAVPEEDREEIAKTLERIGASEGDENFGYAG